MVDLKEFLTTPQGKIGLVIVIIIIILIIYHFYKKVIDKTVDAEKTTENLMSVGHDKFGLKLVS